MWSDRPQVLPGAVDYHGSVIKDTYSLAAPAASLVDLIEEALGEVDSEQERVLRGLLDELRDRLRQTRQNPQKRAAIDALRQLAQKLSLVAGAYDFWIGQDLADALDALTARLLLRISVAPREWMRVLDQHETALRRLPRRHGS